MHIFGQNLVSFATLKLQSKTVEQYNIYFPLLHLNYNLKKWSIIIFFSTHIFCSITVFNNVICAVYGSITLMIAVPYAAIVYIMKPINMLSIE